MPMPRLEMMRSCVGDRETARGNDPAKNELSRNGQEVVGTKRGIDSSKLTQLP